jgi:hypothetical protein
MSTSQTDEPTLRPSIPLSSSLTPSTIAPITQSPTTTVPTLTTVVVDEVTKFSFYSCSSSLFEDSSSSSESSSSQVTSNNNSTKLTLIYDYEIQTTTTYNNNIQGNFENDILYNLANRYELINCSNNNNNNTHSSTSRRLHYQLRRSLQTQQQQQEDEDNESIRVIALDSNPIDESMIDSCKFSSIHLLQRICFACITLRDPFLIEHYSPFFIRLHFST